MIEYQKQGLAYSPSAARLRQQWSRTGRPLSTQPNFGQQPPMFIHPNDTQFLHNINQPPSDGPSLQEVRLAEKAATYERALQKSMSGSKRVVGSGVEGLTMQPVAVDESIVEEEEPQPEPVLDSELGDSYVHGVRTRGPREDEYPEEAEDIPEGGVMGMIAQIYSNQRRTVV